MHLVVSMADDAFILFLNDQGAKINAQNDDDITPLMVILFTGRPRRNMKPAPYANSPERFNLLLKLGADTTLTTTDGKHVIHHMVSMDTQDSMLNLLKTPETINIKDNDGWTPLYDAIKNNTVPTARWFLKTELLIMRFT